MEYNIVVLNGTVQKFKSWSKLVDWWFVFKSQIICFAVLEHLQSFFVRLVINSYLVIAKGSKYYWATYIIFFIHTCIHICLTMTVLKVLFPLFFFYIYYFCAWLNFVEGQSSRKDIVTGTSNKVLYSWLWMVNGKMFHVYWWQYLQITKGKTSVLC